VRRRKKEIISKNTKHGRKKIEKKGYRFVGKKKEKIGNLESFTRGRRCST